MSADWAVRAPHPALRPLITRYIGYAQDDMRPGVHRGLPSRHVTLILSLDLPVRVVGMPHPDQGPMARHGLVGGMHVAPALIAQDRSQSGIHLELNPLGIRTLLGVSAAELSGRVAGLDELGPRELESLPARLAETTSWQVRFDTLDEVLLGIAGEPVAAPGEVGWAWRRMLHARGRMRVRDLAGEVGWSGRHFGERFRRELGLSPKQAARVLRFEHAGALLRKHGRMDLARLAVECGYYDQAHLSNEWREFAGCSPGTWIAEELPHLPE